MSGATAASAVLSRCAPLERPIDLMRALRDVGLSLRAAHQAVTRLAADETVPVLLPKPADPDGVWEKLASLGAHLEWRLVPDRVDPKAIRQALGLTQVEFAARFGINPETIRNWEQGRSQPDGPARTLLRIIEREPAAVERALAG